MIKYDFAKIRKIKSLNVNDVLKKVKQPFKNVITSLEKVSFKEKYEDAKIELAFIPIDEKYAVCWKINSIFSPTNFMLLHSEQNNTLITLDDLVGFSIEQFKSFGKTCINNHWNILLYRDEESKFNLSKFKKQFGFDPQQLEKAFSKNFWDLNKKMTEKQIEQLISQCHTLIDKAKQNDLESVCFKILERIERYDSTAYDKYSKIIKNSNTDKKSLCKELISKCSELSNDQTRGPDIYLYAFEPLVKLFGYNTKDFR